MYLSLASALYTNFTYLLLVIIVSQDIEAFATSDAQEEEYAADLAAYKLTIQDKNPADEFKELVETYAAKHPLNK
jgi:hypothetical protein